MWLLSLIELWLVQLKAATKAINKQKKKKIHLNKDDENITERCN